MVSLPFLNFTPYSSCNSYSVFISIRTRVVSGFGRIHCTSNSKKEFLCGRSSSYRWPEVLGDSDQRLCLSRQFVREARKKEIEIFDTSKKFILMPFELRFLSCSKASDRYVMDLSSNKPELYKHTQNIVRYHIVRTDCLLIKNLFHYLRKKVHFIISFGFTDKRVWLNIL